MFFYFGWAVWSGWMMDVGRLSGVKTININDIIAVVEGG
jgi:hypothetical protein